MLKIFKFIIFFFIFFSIPIEASTISSSIQELPAFERDWDHKKPTIRVLSVQSYGYAALGSAYILHYIEEEIRKKNPGTSLSRCFDSIVGVSTGGLIALTLAVPKKDGSSSTKDALDLLKDMAFDSSGSLIPTHGFVHENFSDEKQTSQEITKNTDRLKEFFKNKFPEAKVFDLKPNILIPIYNISKNKLFFFDRENTKVNFYINDVMCAISDAAWEYNPIDIENTSNQKNYSFREDFLGDNDFSFSIYHKMRTRYPSIHQFEFVNISHPKRVGRLEMDLYALNAIKKDRDQDIIKITNIYIEKCSQDQFLNNANGDDYFLSLKKECQNDAIIQKLIQDLQDITRPVFILSLDGGSIHGVAPNDNILSKIEADINSILDRTGKQKIHLAECFDLIASTSTGGVVALGMAVADETGEQPQYYADKLPDLCQDLGNENALAQSLFTPEFKKSETHDTVSLKKKFDTYFQAKTLRDVIIPVHLAAYDIKTNSLYFFDSEAVKEGSEDFSLSFLAHATSATTTSTYYKAAEDQDQKHLFVDSFAHLTDPSFNALKRAKELYPNAIEYCIISLKTILRSTNNIMEFLANSNQEKIAQYLYFIAKKGMCVTNIINFNLMNDLQKSKIDYHCIEIELPLTDHTLSIDENDNVNNKEKIEKIANLLAHHYKTKMRPF